MPKQMSNRQPPPNILSITYWRKFAVHRVFYIGLAALFGLTAIAYFGSPGGMGGRNSAAERGADAIVTVNGEPISRAIYENQWSQRRQQMQQMRRFGGPPPTPISEVQEQGRVLDQLVLNTILTTAAKKRGLSVSDATIEKEISLFKQTGKDGKPMSDDDLDKVLQQQGGSLAQLREELKQGLLPRVLEESIADKEKLTEDDLLKTFDEVKVRRILFPITGGSRMMLNAKPDAQAKRDAEDVLAKIKTGMDFAKAADQYSKDPDNQRTDLDPKTKKPVTRKQGGLLSAGDGGWYKRGSGQSKEFEEVAFKLAKGQVSDVVKTPDGYQIVKVEDTRRKLPDDYAKTKAELMKQEKMSRAQKPIQDMIDAEKKAAKLVWNDPGLEWRYEFAKLPMNTMMSPVPGQEDKAQDAFLAKLKAYSDKNKDDAAAFLVLGQSLEKKMITSTIKPTPTTAADRDRFRNEAIAAYEQALKRTEDLQTRFRLATLYRESGKNAEAEKHADKIMRLLSFDDDPNSRFSYQQLVSLYQGVGKPEKGAAALAKFQELTRQADEKRKKEEAERKVAAAKAAAEKAAADKKAAAEKSKSGAATSAAPGTTPDGVLNKAPDGTTNIAPSTAVTPPGPAGTGAPKPESGKPKKP